MMRIRLLLLAATVVAVIAGVTVARFVFDDERSEPVAILAPTPTFVPTLPPEPTQEAPLEEAPEIPIARLVIPSIGVDAEVATRGVLANGAMEDPHGPKEVAWYSFSAVPNRVGNIVMAGHVDYINYGAAVFYNLRKLKTGDEVVINLVDGQTATYRVTAVDSYSANTAPVEEIVGPTQVETVTLITCGGSFNTTTREYNERVVVRAERIAEETRPTA